MSNSQKRQRFTTPRGTFSYPKLTEPDTKFKDEGEYSVNLILPASARTTKDMIQQIDAEIELSLEAAKERAKTPKEAKAWETKHRPYKVEEDDDGNETGNILFKFSMTASGTSKKTGKPWTRKPALFDAQGNKLEGVNIGGGSEGKIAYEIIPYSPTTVVGASVKLGLAAVQVLELREWGEQNAEGFGFGKEDGYTSANADADNDFSDDADEDDGSGDF